MQKLKDFKAQSLAAKTQGESSRSKLTSTCKAFIFWQMKHYNNFTDNAFLKDKTEKYDEKMDREIYIEIVQGFGK